MIIISLCVRRLRIYCICLRLRVPSCPPTGSNRRASALNGFDGSNRYLSCTANNRIEWLFQLFRRNRIRSVHQFATKVCLHTYHNVRCIFCPFIRDEKLRFKIYLKHSMNAIWMIPAGLPTIQPLKTYAPVPGAASLRYLLTFYVWINKTGIKLYLLLWYKAQFICIFCTIIMVRLWRIRIQMAVDHLRHLPNRPHSVWLVALTRTNRQWKHRTYEMRTDFFLLLEKWMECVISRDERCLERKLDKKKMKNKLDIVSRRLRWKWFEAAMARGQ